MVWKPNVTVAAVVEQAGKYLLVEEESQAGLVLNQPAGHLEPNESLIDAVIRETREESACLIEPTAVIGTYLWRHPVKDTTFLRVTFLGHIVETYPEQGLDDGIVRNLWMSRDELIAEQDRLRSPLVIQSIDDYLSGEHFPLHSLKYCIPS